MTMKKKDSKEKSTKKKHGVSVKGTKAKVAKKKASKSTAKRIKPTKAKAVSKIKSKIKTRHKKPIELTPKTVTETSSETQIKQVEQKILPQETVEIEKTKIVSEAQETEANVLEVDFPIIVKDLAVKLQIKPSVLIKKLMDKKLMLGINQTIDDQIAVEISKDFGFKVKKAPGLEEIILDAHQKKDSPNKVKIRYE